MVVSIIMPAYNAEDFIEEAIDSVRDQSYTEWELIVIDAMSTDSTRDLVRGYCARDARISMIEQPKILPGQARNKGIENSKGELIAFLDADDKWVTNKLEWQVEALRTNPDSVIFGGSTYINERGTVLREVCYDNYENKAGFLRWLLTVDPMDMAFTCAILIKRDMITRVGSFDPDLQNAEDYDLWIRLAQYYNFYALPMPVFYRRKHTTSQTTVLGYDKAINNEISVLRKNKQLISSVMPFRKACGIRLYYAAQGFGYLNEPRKEFGSYFQSLIYWPTYILGSFCRVKRFSRAILNRLVNSHAKS